MTAAAASPRRCPKCRALQGPWERCGNCGARLTPDQASSTRQLILSLSLYILGILGGLVLVGGLCALALIYLAR